MDQLARAFLPPDTVTNISLDRLMAELEAGKPESAPTVAVNNTPPKIFVNYGSAILLLVEGKPVLAPIEKTKLEFVVNTNWDAFLDKSYSQYYLLNDKQWLTAASLEGPWTAATKLPKDMSKLPGQPNWENVKKAIPPPSTVGGAVPKVFYSNTPAEIITFQLRADGTGRLSGLHVSLDCDGIRDGSAGAAGPREQSSADASDFGLAAIERAEHRLMAAYLVTQAPEPRVCRCDQEKESAAVPQLIRAWPWVWRCEFVLRSENR
jgi:hypothetical protein